MAVTATIALSQEHIGSVGRERIKLLEAVGREGSISAAARAVGLSYKAAWDALDAMQNLVTKPLLEKKAGGRSGGGAVLTPQALKLIETFHQLEAGLAIMIQNASDDLSDIGLSSTGLLHGFMMKTSARNVLSGHVQAITIESPAAFVDIRISDNVSIQAEITAKSVERLGLVKHRQVAALIKATFVKVAPKTDKKLPNKINYIEGVLRDINTGEASVELVVEIDAGKTLVATARPNDAIVKQLKTDMPVIASFDAENIIIATS